MMLEKIKKDPNFSHTYHCKVALKLRKAEN